MRHQGPQRAGLVATAIVALAAMNGCMDLSPRAAGVCGNGVREDPDEDCDSPGDTAPDAACNAQCRLVCQAQIDCPAGWGCGADHLCDRATGRWHEVGTTLPEHALDLGFDDLDGDGRLDLFGYDAHRLWADLGVPGSGFTAGLSLPHQGAAPAFGGGSSFGFDTGSFRG